MVSIQHYLVSKDAPGKGADTHTLPSGKPLSVEVRLSLEAALLGSDQLCLLRPHPLSHLLMYYDIILVFIAACLLQEKLLPTDDQSDSSLICVIFREE